MQPMPRIVKSGFLHSVMLIVLQTVRKVPALKFRITKTVPTAGSCINKPLQSEIGAHKLFTLSAGDDRLHIKMNLYDCLGPCLHPSIRP